MHRYLKLAARYAYRDDMRNHCVGAVAVRSDGKLVHARNSPVIETSLTQFTRIRLSHAECRLALKLDVNAIVYVARVTKDGKFALAKPCRMCQDALRQRGVKIVYYTVSDNECNVMHL